MCPGHCPYCGQPLHRWHWQPYWQPYVRPCPPPPPRPYWSGTDAARVARAHIGR